MSSNIPRFYETNITVGYSARGNTIISQPIFNTMIDPIPPPPVTPTIRFPPAPAPATRCPPAPAPATRCPAAATCPTCQTCRTCPTCPTITKLKVISASMNSNNHQQLIVEKPNAWTMYSDRASFVQNNSNIAVVSTLPVPSRGGDMRGGQAASSNYTFRPESFNMNTNNKITTDRIPVYFDYYTFFTLKSTNIIDRTSVTSLPGFTNNNLTNSLFVLDKNNIPHYLSVILTGSTVEFYSINKKINNSYMNFYNTSSIDYNIRLLVDIRLGSRINNTITISDITLMPIPISLNIPNRLYAKTSASLATPTIAPFVQPPRIPSPVPVPAPTPEPATITGTATGTATGATTGTATGATTAIVTGGNRRYRATRRKR